MALQRPQMYEIKKYTYTYTVYEVLYGVPV